MFAYAGAALGGISLLTVLDRYPGIIEPLWALLAAWLILGGLLAFSGQLRQRWTGEYVGLPLIFSALAGFGLLQGNVQSWQATSIPSVALLWSFALLLGARWLDVSALYRAARRERP